MRTPRGRRGEPTIPTIINKSRRPIKIALPRGKTLHLGPAGRAQVHDDSLQRPALKKLVEAGDIEVLAEEGPRPTAADGGSERMQGTTHGHPSTRNVTRKGDR